MRVALGQEPDLPFTLLSAKHQLDEVLHDLTTIYCIEQTTLQPIELKMNPKGENIHFVSMGGSTTQQSPRVDQMELR